jgi:hypothetical protein
VCGFINTAVPDLDIVRLSSDHLDRWDTDVATPAMDAIEKALSGSKVKQMALYIIYLRVYLCFFCFRVKYIFWLFSSSEFTAAPISL